MANPVFMVTVYNYQTGPHTYSGSHDHIRKIREIAIEKGIAVSGITSHGKVAGR